MHPTTQTCVGNVSFAARYSIVESDPPVIHYRSRYTRTHFLFYISSSNTFSELLRAPSASSPHSLASPCIDRSSDPSTCADPPPHYHTDSPLPGRCPPPRFFNAIFRSDGAFTSLPHPPRSHTRTHRLAGLCNQNIDTLGNSAGLYILTVYLGVVECAIRRFGCCFE